MLSKYNFRWLYTADFIMTIDYYAKSISGKVLPAFNDISEEANKARDEAYSRLARLSDPEGDDIVGIMEQAQDIGADFYMMAERVRQGIVNMFTAGLYHLFEQQFLRLHREVLLFGSEENHPQLLNVKEARHRLRRDYNIDISTFASWSTLEELSHAANAVKHADGDSCAKLKRIRPALFRHPSLKKDPAPSVPWTVHRQVYLPPSANRCRVCAGRAAARRRLLRSTCHLSFTQL